MSGFSHTLGHTSDVQSGNEPISSGFSAGASVHESSALPVAAPTDGQPARRRGQFAPGVSGNPGGKPKGERQLLQRMYRKDGRKVFKRLEELRNDPETPRRLKAQIDFFIIERLFGRAPMLVGVEGGPSLVAMLAEVAARTAPRGEGA